ncbi:MAG: 50S ribosomal protein L24 [Thermodesulfobacteriota bacterium]
MAAGHIKKGDRVKVIAGKEKGKIGNVRQVIGDKGRVIVEGLNKVKRHQKPNQVHRQGGILEKESPLDLSNVMLMCGKCVKAVRVRYKVLEDGKKVRVCAKCDEIMDKQ